MKQLMTQSKNTEISRIADYPFDTYWSPLYSCASEKHPHIHVLIARREDTNPIYPFKEILKTVRQNAYLSR